ncbi:TRAP-type C4-dicarboxylate transport system permease small subunit [Palleronia aestuarii]|uniref:TRAP transporter small permease protein n=1 Tax=Palleronia aestuarii TaxID=568105 RepID=A0A2W7N9G6_9RHOB|nr:TRAP transporter small permease [Palleronia aestuarii]PZX16293.1 TRAP-type C4-dicarboxylate transport system permease small subunit [Palleronia aestuarii]
MAEEERREVPEVHLEEADIDLRDLRWDDSLVLVIFWVLAFIVFLQFFTRYVLNNSLGWTEEIARFLLIAVTFTGAIMATRKNEHIAVEFVYRWVPRPARRVAQTLIDIVTTGFFAILTYLTFMLSGRTFQMMVSIDVPKSLVYYYVSACFAAMTLYAAWNTWRHLRDKTSRLIDPEAHAAETRTME